MKLVLPKNLLLLPTLLLLFCFSCAPKYGAYFSKPTYDDNNYVKKDAEAEPEKNVLVSTQPAVEPVVATVEASDKALLNTTEPVLEDKKDDVKEVEATQKNVTDGNSLKLIPKVDKNASMSAREEMILDALKIKLSSMTRVEKKAFRKEVKHLVKSNNLETLSKNYNISGQQEVNEPSTNTVLLVILAILLPPLAVFLHEGEVNNTFWLNLLLTLLFFIPGIIHALIIVLQ